MNIDQLLTEFGNTLRRLRKAQGFSQEEFAGVCGLDRTYISGLETGKRNPTLKVLFLLAEKLKVKISELFDNIQDN
jgi:transcriptional regulator with XRE-family HTH domain